MATRNDYETWSVGWGLYIHLNSLILLISFPGNRFKVFSAVWNKQLLWRLLFKVCTWFKSGCSRSHVGQSASFLVFTMCMHIHIYKSMFNRIQIQLGKVIRWERVRERELYMFTFYIFGVLSLQYITQHLSCACRYEFVFYFAKKSIRTLKQEKKSWLS